MPYVMERADKLWEERSANSFGTSLPERPSSYVKRIYGCIFDDEIGLANRDVIGMDQICFETDYPHADSTFPHSKEAAEKICSEAGLNEEETYKFIRGNAIRASGWSATASRSSRPVADGLLLVDDADGVRTITINRPEVKNALDGRDA